MEMNTQKYANLDKKRHTIRAAVFVFLLKEGKTFLLRRQNTGWADGMLTVPSGHVEEGETIREAAAKEAREEAGVIIAQKDLEFMHVHYIHDVYVNFYFKTTVWEGEPYCAEPELCSEVVWTSLDALPADTIYQVRNVLQETLKKNWFSEIENDPKAS